jgi:AAA15 family ATPase/GTPase
MRTPMLERIHIENYKCLRDVTVDLGDFTILIGPNDSGKTSFLQAIQKCATFAASTVTKTFKGDSQLENLVWRRDKDCSIVWEVTGSTLEHRFV